MIEWPTGDASPSGLAFYGGSLWVGVPARGAALSDSGRRRRDSGRSGAAFVGRYGRLRTVVAAPNATLWFSTSNRDGRGDPRAGDDRILQLTP